MHALGFYAYEIISQNMKCKMIQKYADTQSSWINIFLMIYLN